MSRLRKVYLNNSSSSSSSKKGDDAEAAAVPSGPGLLPSSRHSSTDNNITAVSNVAALAMSTSTSGTQRTSTGTAANKVLQPRKPANKRDNEDFGEILGDGDDDVNAVAATGIAADGTNYSSVRSLQSSSSPRNGDDDNDDNDGDDGLHEETFISLNRGEESEGEGDDMSPGDEDDRNDDKMKVGFTSYGGDDGEDNADDGISWFVDVPGASASVARLQGEALEAEAQEQQPSVTGITKSSTGNQLHGGDDAKGKPQKRKRQLSDPESIGVEENILRQMKKKLTPRREGRNDEASSQPPLNFDSVLGLASSTVASVTKPEGSIISIGGNDGKVKPKAKKPKKKTKTGHDDIDDIFGGL